MHHSFRRFVSFGLGLLLSAMALASNIVPAHATPFNDDFTNALFFGTTPYSNSQDTTGATTAIDDPTLPGTFGCPGTQGFNSVWYTYTPPAYGLLAIDTMGSGYTTILAVWTGTEGSLVNQVCGSPGSGGIGGMAVFAGVPIYIEVAGPAAPDAGSLVLHVQFYSQSPNDAFSDAAVIDSTPYYDGELNGYASSAINDPTLPCGPLDQGAYSVWYRFTPPADGALHVDTMGSSINSVLAIWTGSEGALTNVACDDDGGGMNSYSVLDNIPMIYGTTYSIEVTSHSVGDTGGVILYASFTASPPPPTNGLVPMLKSPKGGKYGAKMPAFSWKKLKGSLQSDLEVATDPGFNNKFVNAPALNMPKYKNAPLTYGLLYWHVREQFAGPIWSEWSITRSYMVTALKSPKNGGKGKPTQVFHWAKVPGAINYEIKFSTDPNFVNGVQDFGGLTKPAYKVDKMALLTSGATYYWTIKADNSPWMQVWSFIVH